VQTIRIRRGLDIPLAGAPEQRIDGKKGVSSVALLGGDVAGLRPQMQVEPGDRVRQGQALFTDRQNPEVRFAAPGAGVIEAINRGARRSLLSVVIRLDGDDAEPCLATDAPGSLNRGQVVENLVGSGLWTALRKRPFSHIPVPGDVPAAIFVTAIDTNPHAANPAVVIAEDVTAFTDGLNLVAKLTDGPVYVCTAPDGGITVPDGKPFRHVAFAGPHPAGLVGTHIHYLEPVGAGKSVWHLGYQDVMAAGRQFASGRPQAERIVALGGPLVSSPRLIRTRLGASIRDLVAGEISPARTRLVSGSVLAGRRAAGPVAWLGRYHTQVTALRDGSEREFLSWARPGIDKFSAIRAYAGHLLHRGGFALTTSQNGSPRAMVSIGNFERVMPLDILATPLLKALLVRDTDTARNLGALELDEEDLALCSFVCNGKYEYGPFLRETLTDIEVNG